MASELRVDRITPVNGVPTGGGGGVIQVTQGNYNTRSTMSASAYVASGLSGTITPTRTDSKILVTVTTTATYTASLATAGYIIRRKVGGSYIENSPLGDGGHGIMNTPDGATMAIYSNDGSVSNNQYPMTVQWWDSPATTSEITYELWMAGNGTDIIGMGGLGNQDGYNIYSQIVMMEVSG